MTKYIGPKTADENVATQADKLSLSSVVPDALTPDQAGAAGTATTAARSDHQHEILGGSAGTILPDDVAAEGSSSSFARADHTHAITAAAPSSNLTGSTTNSEGTATSFARSDHSHAITTGAAGTITGTNAEGSSASLARADHNHAIATAAPGTILPDAAAATGSAASFSRSDHTHAIAAASAGTITGTNSEGTSTSFARADHNHAFGDKAIPAKGLPARCGCVVKHSGNQSIAHNTTTQLAFDGEDLDTDGFHSTSTNNGRITVPTGLAGVYSVFVHIRWESTAVTTPNLILQVNGTAVTRTTAATLLFTSQSVCWVGYLAENDYLTAAVYQSSGANKNVDYVAAGALDPLSPTMGAFRLGGIA